MTVEELEIIVTAKVEGAIKEFKKIVPTTKKIVQQIQESFGKIDTKIMTNKIKQAVQFIKNRIEDIKKSNKNNDIKISVNNKDAQKQISEVQKQIDSLEKKINSRQIRLNLINNTLDKIKGDTNQDVIQDMPNTNNKMINQETYKRLENNSSYTSLIQESDKLNSEIIKYNLLLDTAKGNMTQLEQETSKNAISQNKSTSFFSSFKGKLDEAKTKAGGLQNIFGDIPKITKSITNNIKGIGSGLKNGLSSIVKYVGSLFSLKDIYGILSNSAQSWLSSQNAEAQQFSANIEYMKYAMGSVFAPIIQTVINLVYQLMKAIQSVVYAFSGVNIFAKATATSMEKTAGNAKQTNKSLSSMHSEINNLSDTNSESDGGTVSPNMDLSQMDIEMSSFAQKLYDFFIPLKESWDNYGSGLIEQVKTTAGQIGGLIASVWGSFENIITNGTVYTMLELILAIIGNIAQAFTNAWNYNGNGDAIVQNLANAFSNILDTINLIVQSPLFQGILDGIIETFRLLTDVISFVSEKLNEFVGYFTGDNQEKLDLWAIIIGSIASAIALVCAALIMYNVVTGIAAAVTALLTYPITLVILAIAAFIAIIVSIIVYWDEISAALSAGWEWIKQKAEEIFNAVADFFKNLWQGICDAAIGIWNGIKDFFVSVWTVISTFFSDIWNGIKNIAITVWNAIITTISNVINGIKNTISNVLNAISSVWNNIWNGIKTVVTNVWNGIWNTIKNVINSILGGIEGFVNGIIRGINVLLKGISSVANAVGSLIGLNPVNLQLSTISLPRLAKGGVLYNETMFIGGEYSGASTNPEIVTPQNIMEETFDRVMSRYQSNNSSQQHLSIYYMGKEIFDDTIDYINEKTRRTGKCVIKVT